MKKLILFTAFALSACNKCFDGKYSESTMTNQTGGEVELTICRDDKPTSQKKVSLITNQELTVQWGDPVEINTQVKLDGCPKVHDDEHVKIKIRLATNSQTLARLCLNVDSTYNLVPANQFCPAGTVETTVACP